MSGSGTTTIAAGVTLSVPSSINRRRSAATGKQRGVDYWATGRQQLDFSNGTLTNNGTFTANLREVSSDFSGTAGTNAFNNAGTFIKQGTGNLTFTGTLPLRRLQQHGQRRCPGRHAIDQQLSYPLMIQRFLLGSSPER